MIVVIIWFKDFMRSILSVVLFLVYAYVWIQVTYDTWVAKQKKDQDLLVIYPKIY